ncbi:hypothetical protein GCM10009527_078520 [Actinomadura nitritigenes]
MAIQRRIPAGFGDALPHGAFATGPPTGANESFARHTQAKTARWQNRFIEAADLARQGPEASPPPSPVRPLGSDADRDPDSARPVLSPLSSGSRSAMSMPPP